MSTQDPLRAGPGHRRTGGLMIAAAWVLVIGLVSMLFGDLLSGQRNPNREVASERVGATVRVSLEQNRHGHYVASGRINGEPVEFLLDTGATEVSVPAGLAARLRLNPGATALARTANGVVTTYRTTLARVDLGGIVLRDVRASIVPGMGGEQVLLGMSFLRGLEFSQRDRTLTLVQRAPG